MVWVKSFLLAALAFALIIAIGTYIPMVVFKWVGIVFMVAAATVGVRFCFFR